MSDDHKTYWWGVVEVNKQLQKRIKELEAERSSFGSVLRQEREAAHAAVAEAERLRKAIEKHKRHMTNMPQPLSAWHNQELWSALSPSPAPAAESEGD